MLSFLSVRYSRHALSGLTTADFDFSVSYVVTKSLQCSLNTCQPSFDLSYLISASLSVSFFFNNLFSAFTSFNCHLRITVLAWSFFFYVLGFTVLQFSLLALKTLCRLILLYFCGVTLMLVMSLRPWSYISLNILSIILHFLAIGRQSH